MCVCVCVCVCVLQCSWYLDANLIFNMSCKLM